MRFFSFRCSVRAIYNLHTRAVISGQKSSLYHKCYKNCVQLQGINKFTSCQSHSTYQNIVMAEAGVVANGKATGARHVPAMYSFPNDQPVVALDARKAFEGLSKNEQLYAHYLSRASFYGGLIVLVQTSPESPLVFRLIQRINMAQSVAELKAAVIGEKVTEEDFLAYLVYCCGIYTNMGNYKGFGDSKFVPDLLEDKFEHIVKASAAYSEDAGGLGELWESCRTAMWSLTDKHKQLGLGKLGVTKYFSENCDESDSDLVNRFFKAHDIEGYMNRVIKTVSDDGKVTYEIRHAAAIDSVIKKETFEGVEFVVTAGDYNGLLDLVNKQLNQAGPYSANEHEKQMLSCYEQCFSKGSLDAHKDGSRHWIKNKGPAVETYIGFIETYRDPVGMRAEFEGFVAMVNKEQSKKFTELVNQAESLITRLPWPKDFEKDTFLRPDFTSLDVLTCAGSGIPAGINIPNYDEIRQEEGFKNVSLGNVIVSSYKADRRSPFISLPDHEVLEEYRVKSFEVQVGLHELLGHGSGKLLRKEANGEINYDAQLKNPLNDEVVSQAYAVGETYDSKFTSLGSAYEECRAECVGLYLSCDKDILKIFDATSSDAVADDIIYANWLSLCHAAVKSTEMYSTTAQQWKQAHCHARFVILQVLLEAGDGFASVTDVTGEDGQPDILLSLDRTKLLTVGKPAIAQFLLKLQVYKSLGDIDSARRMFDAYSKVEDTKWAEWQNIVIARKQPRKMLIQANTILKDEMLSLVDYESSIPGMIQSWSERFTKQEYKEVDSILAELYKKDLPHFPL